MMDDVRAAARAAGLWIFALTLAAQTPVHIAYECSPEDIDAFGLTCTEEAPCPVFLELASADAAGGRLFVTGNLHTRNATLFGVLLASEDGGVMWTEPQPRIRSGALEQIEFLDLQTGWVSGESIDPLARNPFMLLTTDGGKTWHQRLLSEDTKYGTIAQFHFDSKTSGELVLDTSQGRVTRQELYGSMTGGESWELKQVSNTPLRLKSARNPAQSGWRVRADAASDTYRLERGGGRTWETVTSFAIHVADCK
jgi:photosystem II stability/assembly factor-like uncharacterized protein